LRLRQWQSALAVHAILAALLILAGCRAISSKPPDTRPALDVDAIDRLFSAYDRPGVPGAAVLVVKNGDVTLARGYGFADLDNKTPVTERTNFRLASLSKAFTAMAVMLLVKEGRLDLDDHVAGVVPEFPAYGRDITIRHLLSHTSGLRPYQTLIPRGGTGPFKDRDVLALLQRTDTLLFPAGSAFRYGDTGYAVLALAVEAVSRQPFGRFLHDRIFAPLGMTSTVAWETGEPAIPHRALGYTETPTGYRLADQSPVSAVLGDGGIYSSVHDLAAWSRALDAHKIVGGRLHDLVWSPATLTDRAATHYGFGWFVDRDAGDARAFHHGETSGFTNYIVKYLDRRLTVVILTNRRGGAPAAIAATLAALPGLRTASR
jgi:CubicO group peptidase (beta-lactamase class C family)